MLSLHCASLSIEKGLMRIRVKTLQPEAEFELHVEPSTSITELKEMVHEARDVDPSMQRIICRGKVLKDDKFVRDYNISENSVLHLVVRRDAPSTTSTPSTTTDTSNPPSTPPANIIMGAASIQLPGNVNDMVSSLLSNMSSQLSPPSSLDEVGRALARVRETLHAPPSTRNITSVQQALQEMHTVSEEFVNPALKSSTDEESLSSSLIQMGEAMRTMGRILQNSTPSPNEPQDGISPILSVLPLSVREEWLSTIRSDWNTVIPTQMPFSDAYSGGIQHNVAMPHTIGEPIPEELSQLFNERLRQDIRQRVSSDSDFVSSQFPHTSALL